MKLKGSEWGRSDASYDCHYPKCKRRPIEANDGFQLPFCLKHSEQLPRRLFKQLVSLAPASVFDFERQKKAMLVYASCLRYLVFGKKKVQLW